MPFYPIASDLKEMPLNLERYLLLIISLIIVGFGQPAWSSWLGLIAAALGYALFFAFLLEIPRGKQRFWIAAAWYAVIQSIQLSWLLSHPYSYIYAVYLLFIFLLSLQIGLFSLLITPARLKQLPQIIAMAAVWTLLEWSRFFFLSGYSWNPAGIALTGNLFALQGASLFGIFGLSFWVIFVNLSALRAWVRRPAPSAWLLWGAAASLPYLFGYIHFQIHAEKMARESSSPNSSLHALLVQTAFPAEEALPFDDLQNYIAYVLEEWKKILEITKEHHGKKIDLIVLPEYVVPFTTYAYLYPQEFVKTAFINVFGHTAADKLPSLLPPFARQYGSDWGEVWFVNNAFWAQGLANIFDAELIAGLEDSEACADGSCHRYSAALHFKPSSTADDLKAQRYAKRVLLPMAEYIPFSFCRELAACYGIEGSFTPGQEAKVFQGKRAPFSVSICYEETFGNLMCEGRQNGSEMLVNVSSDVWYPNSRLPRQHFDHAVARTVENGIPLLRACNTGITSAIDSLGRSVAVLGEGHPNQEWLAEALYVELPRYHYNTLYSQMGDLPLICFCLAAIALFWWPRRGWGN